MITIQTTPNDLAALRFAYSPLIELNMSYLGLLLVEEKPHRFMIGEAWMNEARENLRDAHFPYLTSLYSRGTQHAIHTYIADFITPTPQSTRMNVDKEFDRLREMDHDIVRKNVQVVLDRKTNPQYQTILEHYLSDPNAALEILVAEMRDYWDRVLAAHWTNIKSILENDVLFRARQIAVDGTDSLFANLHHMLTFNAGVIELKRALCAEVTEEYTLKGSGIKLVPAALGWDGITWQIDSDFEPMIIYGARGAGLWNQPEQKTFEDYDPSLEITIGAGRARILTALSDPVNTGELARKLNVTAGAISQHLGKLTEAGLVESHRSGNRVFYRLSPRGEQLLAVFS